MRNRIVRAIAIALIGFGIIVLAAGLWVRHRFVGSLPHLEGEITGLPIESAVSIERDRLGIPTIAAANEHDLAFALGFTHSQERFFQMDLMRRNAAGELAELVGRAALPLDRRSRVHRFRARGKKVVANCPAGEQKILAAYVRGVNAGLNALGAAPFEYQLLRQSPKPWSAEDSVLVQYSMFMDLQLDLLSQEQTLGTMRDTLPRELFEFLAQRGTEWDAAMDGSKLASAPPPGPATFELRKSNQANRVAARPADAAIFDFDSVHLGSNNWAIAGKRTAHGGAIVCDDMHLRFGVPHIWYRATCIWQGADGQTRKASGVTLPGTSATIVGSNGKIAWGFTNSEADWSDLVVLEVDQNNPERYRVPGGFARMQKITESIAVADGPAADLEIIETIWGPVIGKDALGRPLAHRWVAHDVDGVNLSFAQMQSTQTLDAALELANRCGIPGQNFVVADDKGRIAWTIAGRLPRRFGHEGRLPVSWADGKAGWRGYRNAAEYPRIVDPPAGQIWTANARVVGGESLATLGFGNYDVGARAGQIRDDLASLAKPTEADMLNVQLDDRAVFLARWQKLMLGTLNSEATAGYPQRAEIRKQVENWGDRAAIDSVGFRLVREFRVRVADLALRPLTESCRKVDPNFHVGRAGQTEGPLWLLVSEQPAHLLDPRFKSWSELLLKAVDELAATALAGRENLAGYTHGAHNRLVARHPLAVAVPALGSIVDLNMPEESLPGDSAHMPRIQSPTHGASQRMAVSPGREQLGFLHMPCGQSGHPASPHYRDMHDDWAKGRPTPLLPGPSIHRLLLKP